LQFDATDAVQRAIAEMGRTEDLRFSPDGERLAFACYSTDRVAIAEIEIDMGASGPEIAVTRLVYLESDRLREPHGIDFLDDETIVVGNRGAAVEAFRFCMDPVEIEPIASAGDSSGLIESPGSVAVRMLESGEHELFACNNWRNTVTRHRLVSSRSQAGGEVVVRKWLDLPDGIAVSRDGRWVAVSNHNAHAVLVYEDPPAGGESDPVAILRGVTYPHGLRFANGDRHLVVADAGAPYVHSFVSSGDWRGVHFPTSTMRVVNDATFARGRKNPAEGGPKGLDIERRTNVLAVTLEEQGLAFYDVDSLGDAGHPQGFDDALVRHELLQLADSAEKVARAEENARRARAELAAMSATKAWRMTAPARRVHAALRARRRRRSA
jgi:hypothetical protein